MEASLMNFWRQLSCWQFEEVWAGFEGRIGGFAGERRTGGVVQPIVSVSVTVMKETVVEGVHVAVQRTEQCSSGVFGIRFAEIDVEKRISAKVVRRIEEPMTSR